MCACNRRDICVANKGLNTNDIKMVIILLHVDTIVRQYCACMQNSLSLFTQMTKDRLVIVMDNLEQRNDILPSARAKSMTKLERTAEAKHKDDDRVMQAKDNIFKEKTQKLINRFKYVSPCSMLLRILTYALFATVCVSVP